MRVYLLGVALCYVLASCRAISEGPCACPVLHVCQVVMSMSGTSDFHISYETLRVEYNNVPRRSIYALIYIYIYIYINTRISGPRFARPRFFSLTFWPRFYHSRDYQRNQVGKTNLGVLGPASCTECRCTSCWHSHLSRWTI